MDVEIYKVRYIKIAKVRLSFILFLIYFLFLNPGLEFSMMSHDYVA